MIETIQAEVTVNNAALRVIADIPLPPGSPGAGSRPDVVVASERITGIAGASIHFSNLADSVFVGSVFQESLDLLTNRLPGLSIQLPALASVDTTIQDTPSSATTHITNVLSSSNATFTDGSSTVLGTTGALVLGELYGTIINGFGGVQFAWPQPGTPNFSTRWSDGISVSQITIGNNGSLQDILGPILLKGDSHTTSATVTTIDGRNDSSRPNVSFTRFSASQSPLATEPFFIYQQVDGLAAAPIYFGSFYERPHALNILGSAASTYDVVSAPVTMKLFAGENSVATVRFPSLSVIGAETVHVQLDGSYPVSNLPGPPELHVEQDPAHPQVVNLQFDQSGLSQQGATLRLESAGNGLLRVARTVVESPDGWRVVYDGADVHPTLNYGRISVTDTGAAGTVVSSKAFSINILATTYPLQILPVGPRTSNAGVTLGNAEAVTSLNAGSIQDILGDIEITAPFVTLDNRNDVNRRVAHFFTDVDGSTVITGLSPGTIRSFAEPGVAVYGGTGGTDLHIDSRLNPVSSRSFSIDGRSTSDVLIGPDLPNRWQVLDQNVTFLNSNVVVRAVPNLRGGSDHDACSIGQGFNSTGSLTGNLDGGPGNDSLYYLKGTLNGVIDLPNHTAPRIAGQTLNIEQTGTFSSLTISNQGPVRARILVPMTPVTINAIGGFGQKRFSATGLPTGISIDSLTGVISGTPTEENYAATAIVSVADDSATRSIGFAWTTAPGLEITAVPNQTTRILTPVNLSISTVNVYATTVTYSATGLPAGLNINAQTGAISGTIVDGAHLSSPNQVTINATDGTRSASVTFNWNVIKSFSLINPGNQITPETVPINLPIQVTNATGPVTYAAFNLPGNLSINSQTGVISGSIANYWYFYRQNFTFNVTVQATSSQGTVSTNFTWQTLPGFIPQGVFNRTNNVGDAVFAQIYATDPYNGGQFTYYFTNLPARLSFNPATGYVQGKIDNFADPQSPYHSIVTFHNTVFNYDYSRSIRSPAKFREPWAHRHPVQPINRCRYLRPMEQTAQVSDFSGRLLRRQQMLSCSPTRPTEER